MSERLDMQRLKAEYVARRAKLLALGESFVILVLLLALTLQYQNDEYMQQWVLQHFWPAAWLLNGTLVGTMAGLLTGWTLATWHGRRSREQKILDDLRKIV
jgi:sterol desaturase/sphingolipid hydroxylase (fatty acid hydroxylase superfamily)